MLELLPVGPGPRLLGAFTPPPSKGILNITLA